MVEIPQGRQLLEDPLKLRSPVLLEEVRSKLQAESAGDRRPGQFQSIGITRGFGTSLIGTKPDFVERQIFARSENGFPVGKLIFVGRQNGSGSASPLQGPNPATRHTAVSS